MSRFSVITGEARAFGAAMKWYPGLLQDQLREIHKDRAPVDFFDGGIRIGF